MIRVLFFVVLLMVLVALRANLRARRTYAHIGTATPVHLNVSLLILGGVVLIALANLTGLTTSLGVAGVIVSGVVACVSLVYAAATRKPGA